jgi:hypothetical protein
MWRTWQTCCGSSIYLREERQTWIISRARTMAQDWKAEFTHDEGCPDEWSLTWTKLDHPPL